jgi:glutaredoxin
VHDDADARKELISLGSKTIPTTVINGEVIVGFEIERIKELIGL